VNDKTKFLGLVILAIVVGAGSTLAFMALQTSNPPLQNDTDPTTTTTPPTGTEIVWPTISDPPEDKEIIRAEVFEYEGVWMWWLQIGGFKFKHNDTVVYVDPYGIVDEIDDPLLEPADYIIVTHDHLPHASSPDIAALSDDDTIVIASRNARYSVNEDFVVNPGDTLEFDNVTFEFVHMYNVNKFRPNGHPFHIRGSNSTGVIINFGPARIYHAGDTDPIPEMADIVADIALIPCSGYAWANSTEAAIAVEYLKQSSDLKYAIPIHYGTNQGTILDAERFADLTSCSVVILQKLF
jgi:L-ascorbate metabolism protein UlaG (beta-lactamase superfamily)